MSIVPLFVVLSVIASFVAVSNQELLLEVLNRFFPKQSQVFIDFLQKTTEKSTVFGVISFLVSFYFASRIFTTFHTAVVYVFEEKEVSLKKSTLIYIFAVPVFILSLVTIYILSLTVNFILEIITSSFFWKYLDDLFSMFHLQWLINLFLDISKIVNFLTFFVVVFLIYYYFPPVKQKNLSYILLTTVVISTFLVVVKLLFNSYIAFASKTNPVYGSLSGVFAFLTWLYISFSIILIGARTLYYLYQNSKSKSL